MHHLGIYGPTNLHLYPLALRYLTSSASLLSRHTNDLKHILQVIDEERIIPPLAVVQLLSRNNIASIGVVKDWLKSKVAETRQDVESVSDLIGASDMPRLTDSIPLIIGQETGRLLPFRDTGERERYGESYRYGTPAGVPGHTMCLVRGPAGSAERAFHVQTQLSPEVIVPALADKLDD
jgi:hypothetical protein